MLAEEQLREIEAASKIMEDHSTHFSTQRDRARSMLARNVPLLLAMVRELQEVNAALRSPGLPGLT